MRVWGGDNNTPPLTGEIRVANGIADSTGLEMDLFFSVFLPPMECEAALFISRRELEEDLTEWEWGSAVVFDMLIAAAEPISGIIMFLMDIEP